jgi:hypothetical protein
MQYSGEIVGFSVQSKPGRTYANWNLPLSSQEHVVRLGINEVIRGGALTAEEQWSSKVREMA